MLEVRVKYTYYTPEAEINDILRLLCNCHNLMNPIYINRNFIFNSICSVCVLDAQLNNHPNWNLFIYVLEIKH